METTQILITVPTLNEILGWLVFYLFIGNIVALVGCFGLVMSDYGRTVRNGTAFQALQITVIYWLLWPLAIHEIKGSYKGFNRDYKYYYHR
ncbi:hypothetical protein [Vibrio vulnificus]|uniref:hypothetical protein n=1 Tax=Vibrio vulnificus TaxID=672 RepID=UPI0019D432CF|nr:hypothetical protein [Vibrio vulnificus]MBN8085905.1 hypothetical protein [Vibrio vulnificus]MBN8128933.1 hypothetical protein [Vibrio vulnificus]HAS6055337.1 hypothetical protein [Vibrio vulnificus]HAS6258251.1 hypothetical protein [Vibrio vulnificus]HDY8076662.1 hypothetical protein [Vibrio vulnificus]